MLSAARPARHFPRKRNDPDFRTKPQFATDLAGQAHEAGFTFRAVVADCGYGGHDEVRHTLREAGLPFVMALKPRRGTWACKDEAHTLIDAARALTWTGPGRQPVPAGFAPHRRQPAPARRRSGSSGVRRNPVGEGGDRAVAPGGIHWAGSSSPFERWSSR
ncbi:transposase [Streptomyces nymphaeiformis]|uniref:Transposase IS701-like DDE domain-containing protein n=1 Tax=Streptomyces nymphaeiformis TaxID=2663842 RepID=A0A7W7TXL6_9ACTN|nr:hypothetical protein [Streptomyces nymphaeiformis]